MLKLAVAQLNFTVGDFEGNLQAILSHMLRADRAGAHIVVFSELALCGYYPGDLLQDFAFLHKLERSLDKIRRASRKLPNLVIVLGTARPRKGPGKPLHNSLLAIRDGQIIAEYHKQLLMQHGVFDEHRHFEAAPEAACIAQVGDYSIGFLICEDGWNDQGADYKINPFNALRAAKPDLVISINASPADMGKRAQCHSLFAAAAKHSRLPLLYVNQIGAQDQWVFDGASFAVSPQQGIAFEAARFAEDFQVLGFLDGQFIADNGQALTPPSPDGLSKGEFISNQIVLGLRDYVRRCGYARVVLACAGGVHDALALVLAVQALGASSVFALHMPSADTRESDSAQLVQLCAKLGVKRYEFPIDNTMAALSQGFQHSFASELYGLSLIHI
jgi:NAD+ synthase (glutamine-hydrolysing)